MSSHKSCIKTVEKVGIKGDFADKICKLTISETCALFRADPTKNPHTGRRITENGPIYNHLVELCRNVKATKATKANKPAKNPKPTRANRAILRTAKTPEPDDDLFFDADDDMPPKKKQLLQQQQQQQPPIIDNITVNHNMSPHDLRLLKDQIILNIRDELIIKIANSIKGHVVQEVSDSVHEIIKNVEDDVRVAVISEIKKGVVNISEAAVNNAIDKHQTKLNTMTDASSALIQKETEKSLLTVKDAVNDAVKSGLLIDLRNLWDTTISAEIKDSLKTHATSQLKTMIDRVIERLAPLEKQVAEIANVSSPDTLYEVEVSMVPEGIRNQVEFARVERAVRDQKGILVDYKLKKSVMILVVRDKAHKPNNIKVTHNIVMNYDDFKEKYAQVLPKCIPDSITVVEAKVKDRNFAFQEDYQNPTIRRFIVQCKGNIVDIHAPNIDVLILDPSNPLVAAVDNPRRMVLDANQFKRVFMYKCLNNKLIDSKHVSFAPGFEDGIGLTQHLNTCSTILLRIDDHLEQTRDFIIYDEVKDPGGAAAKASAQVVYHTTKSAILISSGDFMNTYINSNVKSFYAAVSNLPDNTLKGMAISFAPDYVDKIGLEAYISTRTKFYDVKLDKNIDRDLIIYDFTDDPNGVKAGRNADVKAFLNDRRIKKPTLMSNKDFINTHVRKHASIYNSVYANKIKTIMVGGKSKKKKNNN